MQFHQNQQSVTSNEAIKALFGFQLDPSLIDKLAEGEKAALETYVNAFSTVTKLYLSTKSESLKQELRKSLYKDAHEKFLQGCDHLLAQPIFRGAIAEVLKDCTKEEQATLVALFPTAEQQNNAVFSKLATEYFSIRELCTLFGLNVTGERGADEDQLTPYLALGDAALRSLSRKRFKADEIFITALRARGLSLSLYRRGFTEEGTEKILRELLQFFPENQTKTYLSAMNLNIGQFLFGFIYVLQQTNAKEAQAVCKLFPIIDRTESYSLPYGIEALPLPVAVISMTPRIQGLILNPGGFMSENFFGAHALPGSGRIIHGDL